MGAHWKLGFEWVVHAPIALNAGIANEVIEAIRTGAVPVISNDDELAVYSVAHELVNTCQVSDLTYANAQRVLGINGLVDLIGVLGSRPNAARCFPGSKE